MELKEFIGKKVICTHTGMVLVLREIASPYILAQREQPDEQGRRPYYSWNTVNGDPISTGSLVFEDPSLKVPFLQAYEAHCHSSNSYWEQVGYWMRRD